MNRDAVVALFAAEMRMLLRDRRVLFASILLPILVLPLFFAISARMERRSEARVEAETYHYAVLGSGADLVQTLLEAASDSSRAPDNPLDQAPRPALEEATLARSGSGGDTLSVDDAIAALRDGEIEVYVEALSLENVQAEAPEETLPVLRIGSLGNRNASQEAAAELRRRLADGKAVVRARALRDAGLGIEEDAVLAITTRRDLASASERAGAAIGTMAVLFLLLFLLPGGSIVAADTLAGEKERGTLETLLTSSASRAEIVGAKLLLVTAVGLFISLVQVVNLAIYQHFRVFASTGAGPGAAGDGTANALAVRLPAMGWFWLVALLVPLAVLVSAALLWLSGRARTYKDFQLLFFPFFLLLALPAAAPMLPALELRSAISIVPIANLAVAVREVLAGRLDAPLLLVVLASSLLYATLVVRSTMRALATERLVTANDRDLGDAQGGPALFARHMPRWFAAGWVAIFLVSANVERLATLVPQVLFNLVGVFFLGSLFLIRRYRLPLAETLALRPPPWQVWPAVLVGAPAMLLVSVQISVWSQSIFPIPQSMAEAFAQSVVPDSMPLVAVVFFVALVPAVAEEFAFRGVLLWSLHRRLAPLPLALVTGTVFALFHFSLFRLIPTGVLGFGLALLTLATGSLYPAIAWHFLNNALAVVAQRRDIDLLEFDGWVPAAAAGVMALAIAWIWRHRRPYPGLVRSRVRGSGSEI